MLNSYKTSELVVVGARFFTEGGDWRSIYSYVKEKELCGARVSLILLGAPRGFRQFMAAALFSPVILVNCIAALAHWPVLMMCLLRRDARVYLHATEHALEDFRRASAAKYWVLKHILRRNTVLCVSRQAAEFYRRAFGTNDCRVVYECPGNSTPPRFERDHKHILMVGSINKRKGVELFSKVADLAKEQHPDWRFHWVGSLATLDNPYLSPNVSWHGWRWNPTDYVRGCDLFFLSSEDDPLPLAAVEALQHGRRSVVYKRTGLAELIRGAGGCAVYDQYDPRSALAALKLAFNDKSYSAESISEKAFALTSVASFVRNVDKAVSKQATQELEV